MVIVSWASIDSLCVEPGTGTAPATLEGQRGLGNSRPEGQGGVRATRTLAATAAGAGAWA